MDLYAVRWPSGTYTVCAPGNEPLPSVRQPSLWVGQGSDDPLATSKLLDNTIRVEGLPAWGWSLPGTILLRIPEPIAWEHLQPVLAPWLSAVFGTPVVLQEVNSL